MRYASLTVETNADGHIVIATSAKIESQIGVLGTPAASSAGRLTAAPLRPATGLRCVRAGAWRATLLAREIGTTLLFIRSPVAAATGYARSIYQTAIKFHWAAAQYPPAAQPFWGWPRLYSGPDTLG